jgi:hypothetical protein
MSTIVARTRIVLAGLLTWGFATAIAQTRSTPAARSGQEYHIEVNTLPGCFFYGCEQPVRAGNIRVTAGGVRVRVRVAQPPGRARKAPAAVPVHLLVAFAPGTARPSDAELLAKLRRVLAAGWLVSVCRADGTFTSYARAAELRRALAEHGDAPKEDAGLDAIESAIVGLRAEPGYRVVLVDMGGHPNDKFVRWLASATDKLSPVYVNDGGKPQMPYSPSSQGGNGGSASAFAGAAEKKERTYMDGVFHEMELNEAFRHALEDARFDYDVEFRVPAAAAADAPVKLTFLDPGTHLPYELRTDLYTVERRQAGGRTARQRADATERLKTVEK